MECLFINACFFTIGLAHNLRQSSKFTAESSTGLYKRVFKVLVYIKFHFFL
jgi:hypothetical protein